MKRGVRKNSKNKKKILSIQNTHKKKMSYELRLQFFINHLDRIYSKYRDNRAPMLPIQRRENREVHDLVCEASVKEGKTGVTGEHVDHLNVAHEGCNVREEVDDLKHETRISWRAETDALKHNPNHACRLDPPPPLNQPGSRCGFWGCCEPQ